MLYVQFFGNNDKQMLETIVMALVNVGARLMTDAISYFPIRFLKTTCNCSCRSTYMEWPRQSQTACGQQKTKTQTQSYCL